MGEKHSSPSPCKYSLWINLYNFQYPNCFASWVCKQTSHCWGTCKYKLTEGIVHIGTFHFLSAPPLRRSFFGTVDSALSESSNFCYYGRVGNYNCMKGTHRNRENKKILPLRNLHCQCHFFKTTKYFALFLWVRVNSAPSWLLKFRQKYTFEKKNCRCLPLAGWGSFDILSIALIPAKDYISTLSLQMPCQGLSGYF